MFGPDEVLFDFASCDPMHYGLVPRAAIQLFEGINARTSDSTFIVQCSYLEVYNDRLNDVLGRQQNLKLRELGGGKGVSVEGLTYEVVTSVEQVMSALKRGQDQRIVAPMAMNPRSSRGHGIFTIYVKEMMESGPERQSKLNLVDLAGMESSKKSAPVNPKKERQEEAKNINQSLYALGSVIEKLSGAGGGKAHVPESFSMHEPSA